MSAKRMRVGELARRTGLSVRALHYYDEIGLLSPSQRSESGYRLYNRDDVALLQKIKSLQQLGLSLAEIRACLDRSGVSSRELIARHLARLDEQIKLLNSLRDRLKDIASSFDRADAPSIDMLLTTIEVIQMSEKYYTPEQLEKLKARRQEIGEERIQQVQAEWKTLFDQFRAEMKKGTDPASKRVQKLARRAQALIEAFTGGDPGIEQSLSRMYQKEGGPQVLNRHGYELDQELWVYMGKAREAIKGEK